MRAVFLAAHPYQEDAMSLPVADVEAAISYYEKTFGFRVVSRKETPYRSVILARDQVQIGLAENGGDPSSEGCFFLVEDLDAAFEEIHGTPPTGSDIEVQSLDIGPHRVFFHAAPDGLCYMLAEPHKAGAPSG